MADSPGWRSVAAGATVALLTAAVASFASPASAAPDKTLTASNTGVVTIPDRGQGSPYPTTITVPADRGVVTDVDVTLVGLDHTCIADLAVFLISPTGGRAIVTADAGTCAANPAPLTLTFDDEAAGVLPDSTPVLSGSYKPVDNVYFDPAIPASLAVFDGAQASGTWGLYVYDLWGSHSGSLTGGWSLDIDYNDTALPTGSVVVNGGASLTSSRSAMLTLNAGDRYPGTGVVQMRFSNDGVTWSAFQPYAATATWSLVAGSGKRTVYAQFADAFGNLSAPAHDSLALDTAAPKAKKLSPAKGAKDVSVKTNVTFVASEKLDESTVTKKTVRLTAGGKGVKAEVSYSANKKKVTLKPAEKLTLHTRYKIKVSAQVTDLAGNGFAAKSWTFTTR